jgi:hypothetical protein
MSRHPAAGKANVSHTPIAGSVDGIAVLNQNPVKWRQTEHLDPGSNHAFTAV